MNFDNFLIWGILFNLIFYLIIKNLYFIFRYTKLSKTPSHINILYSSLFQVGSYFIPYIVMRMTFVKNDDLFLYILLEYFFSIIYGISLLIESIIFFVKKRSVRILFSDLLVLVIIVIFSCGMIIYDESQNTESFNFIQ